MQGKMHGLIGFTMGKRIWSRIINEFGGMPISHTVIGFWDDFVVEATQPKVKVSRVSKYAKRRVKSAVWYKLKGVSQARIDAAVKNTMKEFLDRPYGTLQLLGYIWVMIKKILTGKAAKNPWENDKKRIVCAGLVIHFLKEELKLKEFKHIDVNDRFFMRDLYYIVTTNKKLFTKVEVKL